ncbi:ascorbate peroxidase [Tanacetum coccineum]
MEMPVVSAFYLKEIDKARREIRALIYNKKCADLMLRLAWNDAGTYDYFMKTGGPNGSIRNPDVYSRDSNKGLKVAIDYCGKYLAFMQSFHRLPYPKHTPSSMEIFELIHVDLWGPYKAPALNGAHYFYTIVDDKSKATWTYLVHTKDQVLDILSGFVKYAEVHFNAKFKFLRSDNGTQCGAIDNRASPTQLRFMVLNVK